MNQPTDGRGTGRTYRAVAALPDGGTYLLHNNALFSDVRRMLVDQGRASNALKLVSLQQLRDNPGLFSGLPVGTVAIDHWVLENATPKDKDRLIAAMSRLSHPMVTSHG